MPRISRPNRPVRIEDRPVPRVPLLALLCATALGGCMPADRGAADPATTGLVEGEPPVPSHLFVWASADTTRGAVLAAFDIRPGVPDGERLIGMVEAGAPSHGAHHTEHALGGDGLLFANSFSVGRSFLFDVRDPREPRLLHAFGDAGPYSHPHSFERLPGGHTLATFQWKRGGALPGGLVELDREGRPVRWASAAPPSADSTGIVPYSLVALPALDRVVSTSTHMIEDIGVHVQVWRLSDLQLLHTLEVPLAAQAGSAHDAHAGHDADRHRLPGEPRVLADGRTVMFGTFTCGLYHVTGLDGDAPRVVFSAAFPGADCAVPVVVGRWWIQTVPALNALVALDVSDPAAPREVSRLVLGKDVLPHWLAADASGRLLVTTSASPADPTLRFVRFDPATGTLTLDTERPTIDLRRVHWADGYTGPVVPHGSVFSHR
jgi:hypothetical protein